MFENRLLRGMFLSWREEVIRIWGKLHKEELFSFQSEAVLYQYEQVKETQMCGKCRGQGTDKKCYESLSGRRKARNLGVEETIILK